MARIKAKDLNVEKKLDKKDLKKVRGGGGGGPAAGAAAWFGEPRKIPVRGRGAGRNGGRGIGG